MSYFSRLLLAASASVLLTNCGLINTALRLAPMAMMFVEADGTSHTSESCLKRGKQVEDRGIFVSPALPQAAKDSGLAAR